MTAPSPFQLWRQANGDRAEYNRLLREHGHILGPDDPRYEEASAKLPCGWPPHVDEANYCRRCDLFIGYGAAGVARPPEERAGDEEWLRSHCWICGRSRDEIAAEAGR